MHLIFLELALTKLLKGELLNFFLMLPSFRHTYIYFSKQFIQFPK